MFNDPSCAGGGNAVKNVAAGVQQDQANHSMAANQTAEMQNQPVAQPPAPAAVEEFMAGWNGDGGLTAEQEEELANAFNESTMMGLGGMPDDAEAWMEQYAKQMEELGGLGAGFGLNDPPPAPSYTMVESNQYAGQVLPLQQGVEAFHRGELPEAIQMLETTATADNTTDAGEAWRWLGMAHAETDDDRQAIAALLKAVETDNNNLEALLELGVSCTNELDQNQALAFLEAWLEAHPVYSNVVQSVGPREDAIGTYAMTGRVIEMFKHAAEIAQNDADPFSALGVLCNLSREYDEAAGWFKKALQIKPSSHSLWNKLGATQANGSRSKDALHAYNQALALKPTYVRAWINMGISYQNQSMYQEACCYFLKGLSLNPESKHVWSYLRMGFTCMERSDLTDRLNGAENPHPDMFRDEFKF